MTVEGLNQLDLSYTPPLSSPWDPVQMAAQAWWYFVVISKPVVHQRFGRTWAVIDLDDGGIQWFMAQSPDLKP
jgi:hypothetical protein